MAVYPLYKMSTPYNGAELVDLDFAQSFDTIYLAHEYYPVSKLVRADHADWSYSEVSFSPGIAPPTAVSAVATVANTDSANSGDSYFPQSYSYIVSAVNSDGQESRGSTPDAATNDTELPRNYTTISWVAPAGTADYYRVYKAHESGSYGFIGETEGLSFTDDGFQPDYADAPIEAYSPFNGTGKYPARLGFWEQRLWFGRTTSNPNAVFASRTADFENMDFARPQRENDSISMSISTGESNVIEAFIPMDRLMVGTSDNIFSLVGPNDDVLVPTPSPGAKRHVGRGIARPKPLMVGEVAFYQPRVETGLRTIGYSFEIDGYRSSDVSIFAPHLFENYRIVRMAYQAEPASIIWCVRNDGVLLAFTWEAEQQVWGWTEMDVGGKVLDICCVPEGEESRVYLTVEREINGETVRYVEYLDRLKWTDYRTASFLDCSRIYVFDEPQTRIFGLAHLEGETVMVLADGYSLTTVVAGGEIHLEDAATYVIVGLAYDAIIETLPIPPEPRKKITGEIYVELVESFDVKAGRRETELELVRTRQEGEIGAPVMFTGYPEPARPTQVVDRESTIIVKQTSPYPMTVTGLYYGVEAK
ncbi:hypothetical protein [Sphingopyxis macrogoltabida]|uniref:Uncharacterized protein n=1 Tax=Sphingopyxis macrogoltabida TaxID=33050 RepID=A0AAC9AX85_SPHMC|nr:hypothetical protein [Sphingopyxis macrogoltabida]ALJ15362.1 hypothetical protein LH19_21005 [Sphingopyxis macrogoltabida]AMU91611.1 hypothetical protein ATM17_21585 [Sphingopyxis macrogoltabida]